MHRLTTILVFFLFHSTIVLGQEKIAILIANQNYEHIPSLKTPINEIDSIASICESYNFKTFLYKNIEQSDFNNIIDLIQEKTKGQGTVYFHYAGHGVQIDGQNLLVPTSINNDLLDRYELKRKCIRIQDLLDALYNLSNRKSIKSIVCLDACRNNPFQDLEDEMKPGLRKIETQRLPNQSAIVFSCTPGSVSKDGDKVYGKFGTSWIRRLKECNINLSEIQELVTLDMHETYQNDNQMAHFNFNGLSNFYFCYDESEKTKDNRENELFDFYSGVKNEIKNDFTQGLYSDVILKSKWINNFLNSDLNKDTEEKIELKYRIGSSFFYIDSLDKAYSIFNEYWPYISKKSEYIDIIVDTYYFLGTINTLKENWKSLAMLRSDYVTFCKISGSPFDLAITYDKIAGDYERQWNLDSALIFYNKAIEKGLSLPNKSKREKSLTSQFYNNLGNYYLMEHSFDVKKAKFNLNKAYVINKEIEKFDFWLLFDLCRINFEFEGFEDIKEARNRLTELKEFSSAYDNLDASQYFQLKYLEYDILVKENYITKSLKYLADIFNSYGNGNTPKVNYSEVITKSYGNECNTKLWELCIETPYQVHPVIYVDVNLNSILDSIDYVLTPSLITKKVSSAIKVDNEHVTYQKSNTFKPDGTTHLTKNKFERYYELVIDENLTNSYVNYYTESNKTLWEFNIYFSDLSIKKKLPIFIGLKGLKYKGEELLGLQNSIVVFPVEDGVEYIKESLKYDY